MMTAQKRMEEALAQQTILDLARRVGRKAPAEFGEQLNTWMSDRREKKTASSVAVEDEQIIPTTDLSD